MDVDRGSNCSDESGRGTPKEGFELPMREDTPGPIPEYMYSRSKLLDLELSKAAQIRPDCLSRDFDTPDGLWDPEKWFRSFDNSRGNSPLTVGDRKRDIDKDLLYRRRPSDPKERLKEEKDGIVLSPQRRSFGTGCHVTHMSIGRQLSVPGQESGERDRERTNNRRIGSGRIQIDRDGNRDRGDFRESRDRGDREYRDQRERNENRDSRDRGDREFRDFRERGDRDFRDRDRDQRGERDIRAIKDRFDDRDRDRRFDRDNRGFGRREYDDRRDFNDRGHYSYRNRRDSYRNREEDEPEWFTEGPTSRRETIELHGFDKSEKKRSKTPVEEVEEKKSVKVERKRPSKSSTPIMEEKKGVKAVKETSEEVKGHGRGQGQNYQRRKNEVERDHDDTGVASVADRNGSLETNEPSSPEDCNTSDSVNVASPHNNLFDFNEFFKLENIPGLSNDGTSPTAELTGLQSRFSKWFAPTSRDNSRRSSINEDFGYLNDLLSGSKSPVIPSPPPPSANSLFNQSVFSTSGNSTFADKPQHQSFDFASIQKNTIGPMLNALFQSSQHQHDKMHHGSTGSVQDAEAHLKALLFGRKGSTPSSSGTGSPAVASPLNLPGRVKTVAELEADMKPPPSTGRPYPPVGPAHMAKPIPERPVMSQRQTPPQPRPNTPKEQQEEDLTAFNKLLSLMKAGAAAAVESPKIPVSATRPDQRPISPNMGQSLPGAVPVVSPGVQPPLPPHVTSSAAHNEFIQALIRNKEQQLQIRQQTLHQMRTQVTKQSTPIATPPVQRSIPQQGIVAGTPQLNLPATNITPSPTSLVPPSLQEEGALANPPEQICNFIKQNPTIITKPSTPTPPPPPQEQTQLPPIVIQGQPPPAVGQPQGMMGLMQNTSTPRAPSPSALVAQSLLQQPSSPRVPSPIMFSQQPPMHLSAPSPIHPSQVGGATTPVSMASATTLSSSNMSNTIRPPTVPRVPSPQELIAHTQAIMQTALLKKQLEDQKERFIKKQQERGKSPNPMGPSPQPGQMQQKSPITTSMANNMVNNMVNIPTNPQTPQQQTKASVSQAFTPTSVIRKMHSDKAEKLKQDSIDGDDVPVNSPAPKPPIKQLVKQDRTDSMDKDQERKLSSEVPDHNEKRSNNDMLTKSEEQNINQKTNIPLVFSQPPPTVNLGGGKPVLPTSLSSMGGPIQNMSVPPPPLPGMPLAAQGPPPPLVNRALSQDQVQTSLTEQAFLANDKLTRPLVGQGMMSGQQRVSVPLQMSSLPVSVQASGRPIVKGIGGVGVTMTTPTQLPGAQPGQALPHPLQQMTKPESLQTPPQRPIVGTTGTPVSSTAIDITKILQQRQVNISPNPLTRPSVGGTPVAPGVPLGIPMPGRVPLQPPSSMSPNPLYMQQLMAQRQMSPGVNAALNPLNQLALQAQQQRMLDPRLQGMRGVYPAAIPGLTPRGIPTSGLALPNATPVALGRAVSPLNGGKKPLFGGPVSPGNQGIVNGNNNITKQGDPNLMKWFGKDVLKNQLPSMPPLPAQGQKVMTVDEIERCQQAVSN